MAALVAPNSTKLRKTKVALDWFFDSARSVWRFLPTDLTHRTEYDRTDPAGNPLQPARPHEAKGWTHATEALRSIPAARKNVPAPVKALYGSLIPDEKVA